MSDEQKNREEGVNLENMLNDAEQDLQDACEDLRKAYQTFD